MQLLRFEETRQRENLNAHIVLIKEMQSNTDTPKVTGTYPKTEGTRDPGIPIEI